MCSLCDCVCDERLDVLPAQHRRGSCGVVNECLYRE